MKKAIFFLLVITSVSSNAQSLKDALFGGKLKSDSNTVVKKTDDLSTKIDTSKKKPVEAKQVVLAPKEPIANNTANAVDSVAVTSAEKKDNNAVAKDNTKLWKEFMDSVIGTLKTEVLSSKKLKKGDYYILVDYAIEPDGQVTVNNIFPSPENKFLEEQVKERINIAAPRLNPVLGSNGKARKVMKKYNFTLTKE